jgi:hypothetical protein
VTPPPPRARSDWTPKSSPSCTTRPAYRPPQPRHISPAERLSAVADGPEPTVLQAGDHEQIVPRRFQPATGGVVIMKATSISPRSGQRTASSNTGLFLHGHQLERNPARAVTAQAAGTFVLVLVVVAVATDPRVPRGIAARGMPATRSRRSAGDHRPAASRPPWIQSVTATGRLAAKPYA